MNVTSINIKAAIHYLGLTLFTSALFVEFGVAGALVELLQSQFVDAGQLGIITNGGALALLGTGLVASVSLSLVRARLSPIVMLLPSTVFVGVSATFMSDTIASAVTNDPVVGAVGYFGVVIVFVASMHPDTLARVNRMV